MPRTSARTGTARSAAATRRPAVFLDRDGTIIEDTGYLSSPDEVALRPGAADAIARINAAGIPVIVISNQSGIGRGYYTEEEYDRVRAQVEETLLSRSARIDATYICPHAPDHTPPCECRKPGTLLFQRAADDLALDLARSWYIGDRWRDIAPAETLGGHGILVPSPRTPPDELARARERFEVVGTLEDAVSAVMSFGL
ncbi:MAG TPA: HAD family hydrolase [Gemmatimonadaceae bacterium]|nr:HAD family hydrolase [Gemmatimonadaceae bacterium]